MDNLLLANVIKGTQSPAEFASNVTLLANMCSP